MGNEFLNDIPRFCLWFHNIDLQILANDLKKMPSVEKRIELVKQMRLESKKEATQKLAITPHLFGEIRQPENGNSLVIPKVSSERREYIPIGFLDYQTVCGDKLFFVPNATLYHFAILSSTMHNAFMRTVAGRLESRYSYSNTIVYNNFPFPMTAQARESVSGSLKTDLAKLEQLAQAILDVRQHYRQNAIEHGLTPPSLAELYNPRVGFDPYPELRKAHAALDKAVDKLYRDTPFQSEAERVAFLFERYGQMK